MTREQWLHAGESEHTIAGRLTDVSKIAQAVACRVRAAFPINRVPVDLAEHVEDLLDAADRFETELGAIVSRMEAL